MLIKLNCKSKTIDLKKISECLIIHNTNIYEHAIQIYAKQKQTHLSKQTNKQKNSVFWKVVIIFPFKRNLLTQSASSQMHNEDPLTEKIKIHTGKRKWFY